MAMLLYHEVFQGSTPLLLVGCWLVAGFAFVARNLQTIQSTGALLLWFRIVAMFFWQTISFLRCLFWLNYSKHLFLKKNIMLVRHSQRIQYPIQSYSIDPSFHQNYWIINQLISDPSLSNLGVINQQDSRPCASRNSSPFQRFRSAGSWENTRAAKAARPSGEGSPLFWMSMMSMMIEHGLDWLDWLDVGLT